MRIAIVEDNRDGAESLAAVIEDLGHEATIADSAAAAETLLSSWEADLAFIDLLLPDLDGAELARRLRERCPGTVLVAVTGLGTPEARERAMSAGFVHFLLKPYAISALEAVLKAARPAG
jgi:DNA-binding response OmpR family regulator